MDSTAFPTRARKAAGAYYTPRPLVELLLAHAIPTGGITPPARVIDPACGPGDFLLAVRRRLPDARLFGVDVDAAAVERCRRDLAPPATLAAADALLSPPAFCAAGGFDLVVGNPPYVNPIEGLLADGYKARLRAAFPAARGAADLAHYFLHRACELVRPGGRVAMVLPRAILNSPAARSFRASLPPYLRPNLIYAPERSDFFPGAAIFVCLLVLGPDSACQFSADPDPAAARFVTGGPVDGDNWWLALRRVLDGRTAQAGSAALGSEFDVAGSMTTGDAYDLPPRLLDDAGAAGLKLATTGLIEPRDCHWGRRACRYLKRDYAHPRLDPAAALTPSLATRARKACRPKIIVAGLSKGIEAFLDPDGQYIGAVSTYSIFHPRDDVDALDRLLSHLLSPAMSRRLVEHLGANGLRGRHITVKKDFLRALPLP
jgi:hypothetical protein